MLNIFKKEFRSLILSPIGFTVVSVMLVFSGMFITIYNLFSGSVRIEYSYQNTALVLLLAVPLLSMNALSKEHSSKTDTLIFSLPTPLYKVILGKYLALVTIISIPLAITFLYTVILSFYAEVSYLSAFTGTLAFWLCACALLAIGLFISSLFENTVLCALCGFAVMLIIYFLPTFSSVLPTSAEAFVGVFTVICVMLGVLIFKLCRSKNLGIIAGAIMEVILLGVYFFDSSILDGALYEIARALSVMSYLDAFTVNNTVSIPAYVYYITISALFVFFTVRSEEKRRFA